MYSFFWTLVLLLGLMYCFAVYFTELSTEMVRSHQGRDLSKISERWGSIGQAVISLFQAITGGDDWINFVLVFKDASESTYVTCLLFFSFYIAFATLVMLNLV